jgi:hypothetical protein
VNVAARLTELAKRPFHGVLTDEQTLRAAGAGVASAWREAGTVVLRGRTQPTRLFEPVEPEALAGEDLPAAGTPVETDGAQLPSLRLASGSSSMSSSLPPEPSPSGSSSSAPGGPSSPQS